MTGSDLRRRRLRLGWSRNQLAHQLGVSPEAVAEWEEDASSIRFPAAVEVVLRDRDGERETRVADSEARRYVG
jgi:transcriptional regulator with XRE-family HTH domain